MKPMTEKMTKPANIEVDELTVQTISASLKKHRISFYIQVTHQSLNSLVHVVVELVVASKRNQCSQTQAIREEDLRDRINPHFRLSKFRQVGCNVELDAFHCTGKCNASEQENRQQNVWKESGEVDDLKVIIC